MNGRLTTTKQDLELEHKKWLKYNFQGKNKGFEGLTVVVKNNNTYVLALCEGNDCEAGNISRKYGAGRVKVFEKEQDKWKYIASIRLPQTLQFSDYSGMAINDNSMMVITSQESSAIWIGRLDIDTWKVTGTGTVYQLPKDKNGNTVYCNIEGVAWFNARQVVMVSDARKGDQPDQCKTKEQSIHIMSIKDA